jgi:dolichyl-phosphate beta-glucosyltransferase
VLSVVIPAYNEDARLVGHLRRLLSVLPQSYGARFEVVVVDDGSEQPVERLLGPLGQDGRLRVIRHLQNRGKGAALRTGFLAARGCCVVFADADGATPPEDLLLLVEALSRGAAIAVGCRVRGLNRGWVRRSWYRRLASRLFVTAIRWILGLNVTDPQIGFKALRDQAKPLVRASLEEGYLFDVELLLQAQLRGLRVCSVPVHWEECPGSKLKLLRDGARMVLGLIALRQRYGGGCRPSVRERA